LELYGKFPLLKKLNQARVNLQLALLRSLLLERTMDGSELVLNDENLGKMSVILSVRQESKTLFTGRIVVR